MIPTLEDVIATRLERRPDAQTEEELATFGQDVQEVTSTAPGRRMLAVLVSLAHPFRSPARATVEDTHIAIGRKEVVALIWERSAAQEFNPYSTQNSAEAQ